MTDAPRAEAAGDLRVPTLRIGQMIGSLQVGGAERQVVNLLNELSPDQAVLITLGETDGALTGHVQPGVTFVRSCVRWRSLPVDIWRLARKLRALNLDVLQTHMFWANFSGVLAGKLANIRAIVTTEHGRNERKPRWARWLERHVISKLADKRICVSDDILRLRNAKDGAPMEKLVVIPNGTAVREQKVLTDNSVLIIGTLGRLIDAKDYPTLIEAARILRDRGIRFRLYIIGDGPEHARLTDLIMEKGLQEIVQLPGSSTDTQRWLDRFEIYVISSVREGQPLSLLEAMAVGLPIVATNVGGIPSTINDGGEGFLVPPSDPVAMAEALAALAGDLNMRQRLGTAARDRLIKEFSVSTSLKRYQEIYMSILKNKES